MAAFICKAAFHTIPRFGISAILFLCIGLFFIFPACDTYLQLREEKLVPWEMISTTDNENIDLEELLLIEGVDRVSPVIRFDTEIQFGEYKLSCQVQAVHSGFLDVELTEGALYSDSSNMPFLLLNKAAAKSFSSNNNTKIMMAANTNISMTMNNEATNALICGIFNDEKEAPTVYMSYDFAKKMLAKESVTTLLFALSNKGESAHVALLLQKEGINASYAENDDVRWLLMEQQVFQFMLSCIGFLVCSTLLLRKQFHAENKEEIQALLMCGIDMATVNQILSNRLGILYAICIIVSALVATLFGISSVMAVLLCIIASFAHYWSMRISRMPKHML